MARNSKSPSIAKAVTEIWFAMTVQLFDTYHPERHYMRGPGPKYRAKHARNTIVAEPDLGGMANVSA